MSIEINNLQKCFKKNQFVLKDINLNIGQGIFGLLGKNGAGKTTLMRMITTVLLPSSGDIRILGMESHCKNYEAIKKNIGYLPQEFGFYKNFTILDIMRFVSILKNMDQKNLDRLIGERLESVGLYKDRNKKYITLSGGMKRRVGLAQAMLNQPKILIVDEPTAGVDPEERIKIRKLLSQYAQNNTVLFSTHIIEDIEMTCTQLGIMNLGKILYSGNTKSLLDHTSEYLWEMTFKNLDELNRYEQSAKVLSYRQSDQNIIAKIIHETQPTPSSVKAIATLEDAYLYTIQKEGEFYE